MWLEELDTYQIPMIINNKPNQPEISVQLNFENNIVIGNVLIINQH